MALIDLNGLSRFKTKLATIFAPLSHDHDSRYYTENEMDSKLIAKADKTATVSTVTYDSNNKKITKTINGSTTDVVTVSTKKSALGSFTWGALAGQ